MTSILTNIGAISALQTLRSIAGQLDQTQRETSSGLRIGQASDNAAYWSIATTMRSDNGALSAVDDALGLGAAKVDTAYSGMSAVVDLLSEFKAKVVAAYESGVDRNKIQEELEQLKQQVVSISDSASFAGENWLRTNLHSLTEGGGPKASVVSSFTRDAQSKVTLRTAEINLASTSLFNSTGGGILQMGKEPYYGFGLGTLGGMINYSASGIGIVPGPVFDQPFTISEFDTITIDFSVGSFNDKMIITKDVVDRALGGVGSYAYNGDIKTSMDWVAVLMQASFLDKPIPDIVMSAQGGAPDIEFQTIIPLSSQIITIGTPVMVRTPPPGTLNFLEIDVSSPSADLEVISKGLDIMHQQAISGAAKLGSMQSRIQMQSDFSKSLSSTFEKGIGRLVDADMNETSTRLKALQTQQQLAVQSLSIANNDAQNLMTLFR